MKHIFKISKGRLTKKKIINQNTTQEGEVELDKKINEKTLPPRSKYKRKILQILAIIVTAALLEVVYVAVVDNKGLDGLFGNKEFHQNIQGLKVDNGNFQLMNNNAAITSDTSFTVLKRNGKQTNSNTHGFNKPAMDADGSWAIVYNKEGKGFRVERNSSQIIDKNLNEEIICASISQRGIYAVVSRSNIYTADLMVYNSDHSEKYKYHFAENYVADIALNKEGTKAVVSTLKADNGSLKSVIYILNFSKSEEEHKVELNDNMVLDVDYLYNGTPVAIGDKYTSYIDAHNGSKEDFNYDGKTLASYYVNPDDGILFATSVSSDGHNCSCTFIDANADKKSEFATDILVESVCVRSEKISILSQGKAYIYNLKGQQMKTLEVGTDASKLLLCGSRCFYVLGASEIRKVSF